MCFRPLILACVLAATWAAPTLVHAQHCHGEASPEAASHSETSLFQLQDAFERHDGATVLLEQLQGTPTVVVMFYGSCRTACPILFADVQRLEALLYEADAPAVRFVMASLDPERDTVPALATMAETYGLREDAWWLLRGSATSTLELAAALGVRFRRLEDGTFSHSNLITLLNSEGEVVMQVEGLNQAMEPLRDAAIALTRAN